MKELLSDMLLFLLFFTKLHYDVTFLQQDDIWWDKKELQFFAKMFKSKK